VKDCSYFSPAGLFADVALSDASLSCRNFATISTVLLVAKPYFESDHISLGTNVIQHKALADAQDCWPDPDETGSRFGGACDNGCSRWPTMSPKSWYPRESGWSWWMRQQSAARPTFVSSPMMDTFCWLQRACTRDRPPISGRRAADSRRSSLSDCPNSRIQSRQSVSQLCGQLARFDVPFVQRASSFHRLSGGPAGHRGHRPCAARATVAPADLSSRRPTDAREHGRRRIFRCICAHTCI